MARYSEEQLGLYLEHVRYPRPEHPADGDRLALLTGLVRHHQARVPFDSTALHYSTTRLLSLDRADLFDKIVTRGRGGYCMEVNELFATVLRTMGFRSHMVNLVTIKGKKYLVDVGFGAQEATQPIPLEDGYEITTIAPTRGRLELKHIDKQVTKDDPAQRLWVWCSKRGGEGSEWEDMYSFSESEVFPEDFEALNYFIMTRPQSFFLQNVIAYRPVLDEATGELVAERILHGNVVKEGASGQDRVLEVLETEEDRVGALDRYFDIRLTEQEKRGIKGLATELMGKKAD
ncbi:N-acetyltransferase [Diaporthe helianthi]|uniref:N-acetyltransferase n=1 Tax=Diaporthe helianthi TaxID=158607 RepID=A0A2P5HT78_DIAHE|nr:N-acetyltransferase [Diaporthe helianthi]